jgi:predicted SAM-dependent methyltransferase
MRLNLGCADWKLPGFHNIDLPHVDLGRFPWPWEDETVDEILASHILEHFTLDGGERFLSECYRVLKPRGVLHIAVPDMDKFIDAHLSGDFTPLGGYYWRDLNHLMGGDGSEPRPEWRHKHMYNFASLAYTLLNQGYDLIHRRTGPGEHDNPAYAAISLYVDAVK